MRKIGLSHDEGDFMVIEEDEKSVLSLSMSDMEDIDDAKEWELEEAAPPLAYDIVSYGSDPEVESLVNRMKRGTILIPSFQREYVWSITQASRFIESLLLGLPVPGIFMAQDEDNKQLVIDGQQRLKSLQFFYEGVFNPKPGVMNTRKFALTGVQEQFEGKTYDELDERDKVRLDTSIIHTIVVKQVAPSNDDTSLFHVFERLNTGASKLSDQEIRVAIYNGAFLDFISDENDFSAWRELYGPKSLRLRDQEFILRFLALYESGTDYVKPMREFINHFCGYNQHEFDEERYKEIFESTAQLIYDAIGKNAFRPEKSFNASAFDSCMVGVAKRLASGRPTPSKNAIKRAYDTMMENEDYKEAISRATSDIKQVDTRLKIAIDCFGTA